MFDPTSLTVVVVFSLSMPVFSFIGVAVLLRWYKHDSTMAHRILKRRNKVRFSLLGGAIVPLVYLLTFALIGFAVGVPPSPSEVLGRALIMIGLCIPGIYIGATIAGWMLGPKTPPGSPSGPP